MSGITAAAVKSLRERTGLPMMECKKALMENGGDETAAVNWLRERGAKTMEKRADRETAFGRFGLYTGVNSSAGAMVELKCESAPVTQNEDFIQLANDLAQQLATGPAVSSAEELLALPSPSKDGMTLGEVKDDLFNRIREVFNVGRFVKFDGSTGGYSHNLGTVSGVLVEVKGGTDEAAKDVCMHVAAMDPRSLSTDELDADAVQKERDILTEQARKEGKPEKIIEKMVEGRMRNYYAEHVLLEQPFVKEQKMTVGNYAKEAGMEVVRFVRWELGEE